MTHPTTPIAAQAASTANRFNPPAQHAIPNSATKNEATAVPTKRCELMATANRKPAKILQKLRWGEGINQRHIPARAAGIARKDVQSHSTMRPNNGEASSVSTPAIAAGLPLVLESRLYNGRAATI